jgi:hypothetical protein
VKLPTKLTLFSLIAFAAIHAAPFTFSTGGPDGLLATGARIPQAGVVGIESADDFILDVSTVLSHATFTGLFVGSGTIGSGNVLDINVDLYRVFPADSDGLRLPAVVTRVNSPADTEFTGRSLGTGGLTATIAVPNPSFTAANSILNGINAAPGQTTGGEGPVTGAEVVFDVTFVNPFILSAGHYFFVPTVQLSRGEFYWLSAPKPIVAPGTPFDQDLQSWIRNETLDPDWSRIGTDVIGGTPAHPANASFSLDGEAVPEPATFGMFAGGAFLLFAFRRIRSR